MKRLIQIALVFLTLLYGKSYAQSQLPPCPGPSINRQLNNCFGTITWADGDKYVGEIRDGKQGVQGTYYFLANNQFKGDIYIGEFKDVKPYGYGTYNSANGDKYVGGFRDGRRHGQGTYTYANGSRYVGEFKDDKNNGQGTFYAPNVQSLTKAFG
jgi:hypothetical protein